MPTTELGAEDELSKLMEEARGIVEAAGGKEFRYSRIFLGGEVPRRSPCLAACLRYRSSCPARGHLSFVISVLSVLALVADRCYVVS